MFILGDQFLDGYLDYHRAPEDYRLRVRAWWSLAALDDIFVPQPRSLIRLWHQFRTVGALALITKIRSRLAERLRDRRFIAVGLGEVLEGPSDGLSAGESAIFVAPSHPALVERIVVPPDLLIPAPAELAARLRDESGLLRYDGGAKNPPDWSDVAGWSRFSGRSIALPARRLLQWAGAELATLPRDAARLFPLPQPSPVAERSEIPTTSSAQARPAGNGPRAALFGLGNYAKVCILPNVDPRIRIECVHEIEPTQLGRAQAAKRIYDTSDGVRPNEDYDIYLIAGYHHTHTPLATHALERGRWAVVEKPLVTDRAQLAVLLAAMRGAPGRYFAGFNMRYSPLWDLAREDLGVRPGDPVHSHCIVFEVPLPRRHWYNWPNSGSRIISNACHWLDHFLFMNDWAAPVRTSVWRPSRVDDMHISVELANGAALNLSLTDTGSRRIGVQDHIQLRAGNATVRVDNACRYESEAGYRILRRKRVPRLIAFEHMYQTISRRILAGQPGDSLESTERSSRLMLDLEEQYQEISAERRDADRAFHIESQHA